MEVKISPKPNISSNPLFTNTVASNQFNYVNKSGVVNQTCLNIPQIPNPSLYLPQNNNNNNNNNNNYSNNNSSNTRNTYLPPVNNVSRMTITPPGVSSSTPNQNSIKPIDHLPNIQPTNNPTNLVGQSYQPPVSFNNSYLPPQPQSQPPLNQSFQPPLQPSQLPISNQSYQPPQPPSQPPLNQSYQPQIPQRPLDQSYQSLQPSQLPISNQSYQPPQPPSQPPLNQSYQPQIPQRPLDQSYQSLQPSQLPISNQSYQPPQPPSQPGFNQSYQPLQPQLAISDQSYQPPQPPSQPALNQSYHPPLDQSYQQQQPPFNNNNMYQSYNDTIPTPYDPSYYKPQSNEVSAADIPQPPSEPPHDYFSKPDGDFRLTDQIVKNEYHTYVLYDPPLGSGSYATAYLVSCESFTLVMKKMNIKKYQDNVKRMLQDEMNILSSLPEHPNVIQYMDGFEQNGYYYLVMNYCRDGDLLEIIHKHKEDNEPIPENEIIKYITDIANGISFIHKHNVVHRDLKPGNIFIDRGKCVIGDFGISKMVKDESVSCSTFIGTPSYMAPEMFKEEKYDSSVDIWAFGCIIIELCTLNLPFSGSNIVAIMKEIENANIPRLNGYSSFIDGLVRKCIVYDPHLRLTAEEVVNYLQSPH